MACSVTTGAINGTLMVKVLPSPNVLFTSILPPNNCVKIFRVKYTGIGIKETDFNDLFKPFERIESRLKVKTLGTGLGLYLTRKILTQLLGGSIEVKSTFGEGSTFAIKVPLIAPVVTEQANGSILEEP